MSNNSSEESGAAALDEGTRLAFERTYLAHERTQMAWLRTGLALISFGFTIAKFYQYLQQQGEKATILHPRIVGILMIATGLVTLALGTVEHVRALRLLRQRCPGPPVSLAGVITGLLALLGTLALAGAILR